ncbi:hypothetical protein EC973_002902 [Apophysomyces ossiformis]|uniref:Velvet domain-containing protein n=1 Tax=Apophysomyces ossiformis TaxID=679940 RepID=A0A8H7BHS8_9FUNG|nr:hypothetical protein EC973_002902 [Apophysomyces ossiformis]
MSVHVIHASKDEEIFNPNHNVLSGQTVSSMYKLKDIDNRDGGFFVFGDVSVKLEGQFRLKFCLFEITLTGAVNLMSIVSEPFSVYSSKSFPGMLESTFLSRSFSDQGVRIRIRKEHRVQISGSRKRKLSLQDDVTDSKRVLQESNRAITGVATIKTTSGSATIEHHARHPHWKPPMSPYFMTTPPETYVKYNPSIYSAGPLQQQQQQRRWSYCERREDTEAYPEPKTPYSPPHQPYDPHLSKRYYYPVVPKDMPSPPLPARSDYRRRSYDGYQPTMTTMLPPPSSNQPHLPCESETMVRLPPLRDIVCHANEGRKEGEEVDAAVAMMQLAHHPGKKSASFIKQTNQSRLLNKNTV